MAQAALKHQDLEPFLGLHYCLSTMLRKNRFIRKLTHINLTRADIHTLIEIEAFEETTIKDLQPILNMDQSSVSRLVKGLVKSGRVMSHASKKDKRMKLLSLTEEGKKTVAKIDGEAGAIFQTFIDRLSASEVKEVLEFYRRVADWHGQPHCPNRKKENEVRWQQRRTSRAIGVLAKDLFSSGLSSSQWNTFNEICRSSYPLNPKQLSKTLNIAPNSLSIILEKLESLGLVSRKAATHDSRYIELSATTNGSKFLAQLEVQSAQNLQKILHDYSTKRVKQLLNIMQHYLDMNLAVAQGELPGDYNVKRARTKSLCDSLRTFAVTEIVHAGDAQHIPAIICAEDSFVYALYNENETVIAVCEITQSKKKWALNLLATDKSLAPAIAFAFLEHVLGKLNKKHGVSSLEIQFTPAKLLLQNAGSKLTGNTLPL
ncbi:MAG: winged helix-turn-helix transcriptional regulator [Bdellovibrionales bacterium]|nr:winged helix-turn-helix transcriptional regulator [Bdellovibrionales bacterium]